MPVALPEVLLGLMRGVGFLLGGAVAFEASTRKEEVFDRPFAR